MHYALFVVMDETPTNENVGALLARYQEVESTGNVEFTQDVDVTEKYRKEFTDAKERDETFAEWLQSYYEYNGAHEDDETPIWDSSYRWGFFHTNDAGEVVRVIQRTNPDGKYDWYSVGGRWEGFFKTDNGQVNFCQRRDWRIDEEIERAKEAARTQYRRFHEIVAGRSFEQLDALIEKHGHGPLNGFWEQDVVKDVRDKLDVSAYDIAGLSTYSEDQYIEHASIVSVMSYAILKDDIWLDRKKQDSYSNDPDFPLKWKSVVDTIRDEQYVVIVDCHT